jgi:hypothetical protein
MPYMSNIIHTVEDRKYRAIIVVVVEIGTFSGQYTKRAALSSGGGQGWRIG